MEANAVVFAKSRGGVWVARADWVAACDERRAAREDVDVREADCGPFF